MVALSWDNIGIWDAMEMPLLGVPRLSSLLERNGQWAGRLYLAVRHIGCGGSMLNSVENTDKNGSFLSIWLDARGCKERKYYENIEIGIMYDEHAHTLYIS